MDPTVRLRSWTPTLLFFTVVAILCLVGVIQYQWFSRSAAIEIEGTIRGLEGGLRQSVFREFQRFAPVAAELDTPRTGTPLSEPQTRALLDRLWITYGPEGTLPGLLAEVGYETKPGLLVLRTSHSSWTEEQTGVKGDEPREMTVMVAGRPGEPSVILGLDLPRFFESYVFPSLLEQFPGAKLTWSMTSAPPGGENFNSQTYTFNPLTALFDGASVPRTLRVAVPRVAEFPFRTLRSRAPNDGPTRSASFWTLEATLPADAPVLGIEKRLAWNWLGSSLLLVVLGGAFGIVLRQSGRLAALRRREREFVASVSHELRTPLTVIRSAADNFTQGIVTPERQGRYGQLILDQSLRLGRMIEEMLSFAQAEAGSPAAPVKAPLVFETWLGELKPALDALASARQIHLVWDVAGVPTSGLTDPGALRLVLENLVINAVNHAYPAPVADQAPRLVRITLRHLVPDRLELAVDDDGRGIAPQEAKKVFEPFYRDQVSRNTQEKGSGLGLFLARHQVRRLGGELKLETPWRRLDGTRRSGCRFVATLPFAPGTEVDHGR